MRKGCFVALGAVIPGLALLIAASYFILNPEKKVLTPETRASLPGQFIALADGVTHYELDGPEDGPVVVLVNGFSIPMFTWERNVPALTEAGFRVLTFDLYGRGYSDRPDGPYNLDLFVRQIDELLTALKIDRPVDMVGLSMGGYITAGFANRYPDRVRRVVMISPLVEAVASDTRLKIVTLPWLGEYLFTIYIGPYAIVDSKDEYQAYVPGSDWRARELDAMQYAGIRNALLSTLRDMTGDPFTEYQELGNRGGPVELLWGDKDQTIPIENAQKVLAAVPQAVFHPIPGARHESCYEEPEVVNPLIIGFLQK
jgi:pimeloyl-ACP methyl ester carboxylesterase